MEFKLTINMDNAAFGETDQACELAHILASLADHMIAWDDVNGRILLDSNGNHVGHTWVEETEPSSVYAKH